jgi:ABC-2 type transport system permease protein
MRPYIAILNARIRVILQYREAAIAGFGTQLFWGLMRVMIFTAFYRSVNSPQPMTLDETRNYVWLGQALLVLMPWNLDRDVASMIRSGNVAFELVKPVDLYWFWFHRAIAFRSAPGFFRAIPMFIIAGIFFGLHAPASIESGIAFVLSVLAAVLLSASITVLMSTTLFWTISGDGIVRILPSFIMLFSGITIPLPLFPDWAQPIINLLPFRGLMDLPFRLYMGHIPAHEAPFIIFTQLIWTSLIILLGRWLLVRASGRIIIQGG